MTEMDNSDVLRGNHQVNEEKPPPRRCPRCNSDNTRFSYYNNYNLAQPRYTCKNCRRLWTHGGTLKNIPAGGSDHKTNHSRIDQPSAVEVVHVETQQVNHHQPFLHDQETNNFVGSVGGSSSSVAVVGNHFGSLAEIHSDMVFPFRSHPPMDWSFPQGYYHIGSSDVVGNPLTNYNSYRVNQEDPTSQESASTPPMSMNHNARPSGSRG